MPFRWVYLFKQIFEHIYIYYNKIFLKYLIVRSFLKYLCSVYFPRYVPSNTVWFFKPRDSVLFDLLGNIGRRSQKSGQKKIIKRAQIIRIFGTRPCEQLRRNDKFKISFSSL